MQVTRQRRSSGRRRLGRRSRILAVGTTALLVAGAGVGYASTTQFGHRQVGTQYSDGLQVSVADDGTEALRLLGSERIDVAVLDVMMPGPNGLALCRSLRQAGDYSVPVILLTALGEEADRIAGLEAGADDYLTKPFGAPELIARADRSG